MGLFSFGTKEEKKKRRYEDEEPDETTTLSLQHSLGTANLDYLFAVYAPVLWARSKRVLEQNELTQKICDTTMQLASIISDDQDKILSKLDDISTRLDSITRRLDALEREQDSLQR